MKTMTFEELSAWERRIQLGDPETTKLPDGRTVAQARRDAEEAGRNERQDLEEAARKQAAAPESTALSPEEKLVVSVTPTGQILAASKEEEPAKSDEGAVDLPENFPHRDLLISSGFGTLAGLSAASDETLIAVNGLGEKRVKEIRKALK